MRFRTKAETAPKLDLDKALNTAGFPEFLTQYKDGGLEPTEENGPEIQTRFELFLVKDKAAKKLKDFYKNEVFRETKVKLSDQDLAVLEAELSDKIINDRERFQEIMERLEASESSRKDVTEAETKIKQLTGRDPAKGGYGDIKEALQAMSSRKRIKGLPILGRLLETEEEAATREKLAGTRAGKGKNMFARGRAKNVLEDIGTEETNIQEFRQEAQSERDGIFDEFQATKMIFDEASKRALAKLDEMINPPEGKETSTTGYQEAHEYAEFLENMSTEEGLEALMKLPGDRLRKDIERVLEIKLAQEIEKTVETAPLGSNALTKLEKSLDKFLKRERLGSKSQDETREMIFTALRQARDVTLDPAKRLLLQRIIVKNGQTAAA